MNAHTFVQQLSAEAFRDWFQSEVTTLHRTPATRSMLDVMGHVSGMPSPIATRATACRPGRAGSSRRLPGA